MKTNMITIVASVVLGGRICTKIKSCFWSQSFEYKCSSCLFAREATTETLDVAISQGRNGLGIVNPNLTTGNFKALHFQNHNIFLGEN